MKQNSSIFIFLFFASQLFAQIPTVTSTTHWQVYDGNSTWVPSALDFKNYCLSGLAGLLPAGGTTGQVPTKNSGTDYDYSWATPSGGGGDGNGIYDGDGTIPTATVASCGGTFDIDGAFSGFANKLTFDPSGIGDYVNFIGIKHDNNNFLACYQDIGDESEFAIQGQVLKDADRLGGLKIYPDIVTFESKLISTSARASFFAGHTAGAGVAYDGIGDLVLNSNGLVFSSTVKGAVLAKMTSSQKNAISSPVDGMELYDTDLDGKCVYDGTKWVRLSQKLAATVSVGAGAGTGASATIDGTDLEGTVSLTGGTTASASATVFTITFGSAFSTAPKGILIVPFSDNAAALGSRPVYGTAVSTTTATASVGAVNVITNGVVYVFAYHVIQ